MATNSISFRKPGDKAFRCKIQRLNAPHATRITIHAADKEAATQEINRRERFLAKVLTVRECLPNKNAPGGLFLSK